jgi:hypothetical protein
VAYSGLSGAATAAHIHGLTNTTGSAGVDVSLVPFNGGSFGTSGSLSGSVRLTPAQVTGLLRGLTYINFHTTANPGGELRGQIAPVAMKATLNGNHERPTPVVTTGFGSGTFALVRDQLGLAVTYRSLTDTAGAAHIHGPAGVNGSASVLVNLAPFNGGAYGASGGLSGTVPLTFGQLGNVVDGQTYINFHTAANGSGEIRGQIAR